ncbi:MAG: glycine cleavage system aminomethyltransferase GcvT [Rhodospirillaceae bacterium]|nr:glycine cleavage system aminomethyltransferase GcvT [Rhodospirillaceae bacterium]
MDQPTDQALKATPLAALHVTLGAKMVPFAGYAMPVNYPLGVLKEHLHTRSQAGLFDVSHMGQAELIANGPGDDPAAALERLIPGDLKALAPGRIRYSALLNDAGGIRDDFMTTRIDDRRLFLVVNAACKDADFAHIAAALKDRATLTRHDNRALLALQGPAAAAVLARFVAGCAAMPFMSSRVDTFKFPARAGVEVRLFRSGYTGEDGWEISVPAGAAEDVAKALLAQPEVQPIGLGARDSLRLEAGLCLYGSDIDATTTPVEANLNWIIGKRRKADADFPGAAKILAQLAGGVPRLRVGIKPLGRAPARAHTEIQGPDGQRIGKITSGGFGPSFNAPVAMGYIAPAFAAPGTPVNLMVRGQALPAEVCALPFVPHRYFKSAT